VYSNGYLKIMLTKYRNEFLKKASKIHNNKYDYSKVDYKNSYTKIEIICPEHGSFLQLPQHHVAGRNCPLCARRTANKKKMIGIDEFINRSNHIHNNKYDYSESNYGGCNNKIMIICPIHGKFKQIANEHMKGHGCPQCGKEKSERGHEKARSDEFIKKAQKIHNNKYDYSKVNYVNNLSKITIICPKHGEFEQIPNNHLRYGCFRCSIEDRILTTEEFIERAKKIHGDKYDYSKVDYIGNKTEITIICPKHGEFNQIPNSHLNGKNCRECAKESMIIAVGDFNRSTTEEFIKKAQKIHNNKYDYSKANYIDNKEKVVITCPEHGDFEQVACYHIAGSGCPQCAGTHIQNEINDFVCALGFDTVYNDRHEISPYELDIYVQQKRVAIEHNGLYWHSFNRNETTEERKKHITKTNNCEKKNIKLIQINENEWRDKQEIVKSILKSKLGVSNRIYARKCKIKEINSKDHIKFMDQNHIQGGKGCSVAYGLFYQDELVAAMSFNKHKKYQWEITRFANRLDTTVVGGASRLFKRFFKDKDPSEILTYADRRYSDGNLYKKLGFELDGLTTPNYCYVKRNKVFSRQQFQKHKLKNKLEFFDPELTEAQNMFNNKYRRLWDAGNYRFLWRK